MQTNCINRRRKKQNDITSKKTRKTFYLFSSVLITMLFCFIFIKQNQYLYTYELQEDRKVIISDDFLETPYALSKNIYIQDITYIPAYHYKDYDIPQKDTTFKAFMDYRKITDTSSKQYELQQQAYTDEQGLRKIDDMYCVALGTYYADECGGKFKTTLDTGLEFKIIVSDIKRNKDTDKENMYTPMKNGNANLLEFIVDSEILHEDIKAIYGDISKLGFEGNVQKIEKIIENEKRSSIEEN